MRTKFTQNQNKYNFKVLSPSYSTIFAKIYHLIQNEKNTTCHNERALKLITKERGKLFFLWINKLSIANDESNYKRSNCGPRKCTKISLDSENDPQKQKSEKNYFPEIFSIFNFSKKCLGIQNVDVFGHTNLWKKIKKIFWIIKIKHMKCSSKYEKKRNRRKFGNRTWIRNVTVIPGNRSWFEFESQSIHLNGE